MSSRRPLAAASFVLISALALAGCASAESAPAAEEESSEASTVTYSWERNVTFLGEVLGAEDEAAEALTDLEAGIDEAKEATAEAGNGLAVIVSGGELSAMAPSGADAGSSNVRGGLIYDVFGVEPVVEDVASATHGEPISFEFLLEHDPDTLWIVDRDAATGEAEAGAAAQVLDNDIVKQTTAAQNDAIVYLDPVAWYIVYGGIETTQLLIDDVMQIAE